MTGVLTGRTALVTGGGRGIGRAISLALARSGALVAVNFARNAEGARETVASIEAEGGQAFILAGELGTPAAGLALAAALDAELTIRAGEAGLDILVNNVGKGPHGSVETTSPETFEKIFSQNVGATFWTTQAMLPQLRDGGRVVNISSAASRLALEHFAVYSMAKAAIDNFTRSTARFLGPRGITVNSVLPGLIATEGASYTLGNEETIRTMATQAAMGKAFGEVDDIAGVVHALCSPAMAWVTGQLIEASGGFKM